VLVFLVALFRPGLVCCQFKLGMAPVTSCTGHLHELKTPLCCLLQATLSFTLTSNLYTNSQPCYIVLPTCVPNRLSQAMLRAQSEVRGDVLQSTHLDPDDPTGSYMLQAGARFCKCLGSEFLPYLPMVMPQLIQSASLSPDVTVREQDDDGEDIQEEDEDDEEVRQHHVSAIYSLSHIV